MREPTDRFDAWAHWRDRLAGMERRISPDEPQCGFYRAKRKGQYVGVQIDLEADTDDDGQLVADERYVAFVGKDTFYDERYVADIWLRCAGNPISEAEFERLLRAPAVADLSRTVVV